WDGAAVALDPRQTEAAQVAGALSRRYTHRYTHAAATVLILCGRPGPVSVHTPDVCYSGAGFTPGPAKKHKLPDGGEVWVADFAAHERGIRRSWMTAGLKSHGPHGPARRPEHPAPHRGPELPPDPPWLTSYERMKYAVDFALGLLLLVLFAPVMLVGAIAVRLTSPGPAFYSQL